VGEFVVRLANGKGPTLVGAEPVDPTTIGTHRPIDYRRWVRDLCVAAYRDDIASKRPPLLQMSHNVGACSDATYEPYPGIAFYRQADDEFDLRGICWVSPNARALRDACRHAVEAVEPSNYLTSPNDLGLVTASTVIAGRDRDREYLAEAIPDWAPNSLDLLTWDELYRRARADSGAAEISDGSGVVVVSAMRTACRQILRALAVRPVVDHRRFEEVVATLLADIGFDVVELTPNGRDGGKDIILRHRNLATNEDELSLVECKHWTNGRRVSVDLVATLQDVCKRETATAGVMVASSGFTPALLELRSEFALNGIYLRAGDDLTGMIRTWERTFGSPETYAVDPRHILLDDP
jgi:hypothetical protein